MTITDTFYLPHDHVHTPSTSLISTGRNLHNLEPYIHALSALAAITPTATSNTQEYILAILTLLPLLKPQQQKQKEEIEIQIPKNEKQAFAALTLVYRANLKTDRVKITILTAALNAEKTGILRTEKLLMKQIAQFAPNGYTFEQTAEFAAWLLKNLEIPTTKFKPDINSIQNIPAHILPWVDIDKTCLAKLIQRKNYRALMNLTSKCPGVGHLLSSLNAQDTLCHEINAVVVLVNWCQLGGEDIKQKVARRGGRIFIDHFLNQENEIKGFYGVLLYIILDHVEEEHVKLLSRADKEDIRACANAVMHLS